jgi:hypothetical protein
MAARSTLTVTSGTTITSAWGNSVRDHVVPYTGSNDVATEGQLAVNTTADKLVVWNGSAAVELGTYSFSGLSTWTCTAFTQSPSGGSVSMTNARFMRVGPLVVATGFGSLTTGGFPGPGTPIIFTVGGLPLPSSSTEGCIGAFRYFRSGVATYAGALNMQGGGTQLTMQADAQNAFVGQAPSFSVPASGDTVWFQMAYIAASAV